jgi:methyl-accepting chemotaxis protein
MEGATLTHEPTTGRDGGGFTTTKSELFEAFGHLNMTTGQMNSLIDSMDKTAEQMQTMANKLSVKIQEAAARGFHEMARVETEVNEVMQTLGGKIDGM